MKTKMEIILDHIRMLGEDVTSDSVFIYADDFDYNEKDDEIDFGHPIWDVDPDDAYTIARAMYQDLQSDLSELCEEYGVEFYDFGTDHDSMWFSIRDSRKSRKLPLRSRFALFLADYKASRDR